MATTATLHSSLNATAARRSTSSPRAGLTLGALLDVLAKAVIMVQTVSDSRRITAQEMAKVRRLAESL